jgi:hypothetical protein
LLLPLLISASSHKFYVSITKVEFVPGKRSLQVICKVFTDDIEDVLQQRYDKAIRLDSGWDEERIDQLLSQYFDMKLKIVINGSAVDLKYLGKQYEIDITRIFLEGSDIKAFNNIEVTNEILMELFEEQENIIHCQVGDTRRSLVLKKESPSGMLNFN